MKLYTDNYINNVLKYELYFLYFIEKNQISKIYLHSNSKYIFLFILGFL